MKVRISYPVAKEGPLEVERLAFMDALSKAIPKIAPKE